MKMRPSRVLSRLRAGQVVRSVKLNLADPRVAEIAAMCGTDCIWSDLEHVPNDLHTVENQIRAAKVFDVDVMVRVSRGSYSDLVRPLEMDAAGIMVPHVMSADDARRIAHLTRFHPVGRRPVDGGNADGAYCQIPIAEYIQQANEQRFVIIQIEDPEPMAEIEEIAAVPGIDMLFFGPGDYSHALGMIGQTDAPPVREAMQKVAEVARRHGKFAGTVSTPAGVNERIAMGYQFLNVGSDVTSLAAAFKSFSDAFAQSTAETPPPAKGLY